MKKRLLCLLLSVIMLLSLCMTGCSSSTEDSTSETGEAEESDARGKWAMTLYSITGDSTTDEAIAEVEEKFSNYVYAKYKTSVDLRLYRESEYAEALNGMWEKFNQQDAEKKKAEEEAAKKKAEESAYIRTLTPAELEEYKLEQEKQAQREKEEAERKKEEEKELIEQGKDVAAVKDVQMDILFVPDAKSYASFAAQDALLDLTPFMEKQLSLTSDYIHPSFLTAANVGEALYGIPNNHGISTNETYMIFNTALCEKYGMDKKNGERISIEDFEEIFAQIKAGEPGVTPIYGDFDPEGLEYLVVDGKRFGEGMVCVFADQLLGGEFVQADLNKTYNPASAASTAFVDYCALKAKYRAAGYLSDTNQNFFLSVKEMTEEEKDEWVKKGYTVLLYKGAKFTQEDALQNGLFAISSRCEMPERAAEVLNLLETDPELRNIFTFGIKDTHYMESGKDGIITKIDDSYSMDFFRTGNTYIGYLPDTIDPDYVTKAKEKNYNSRIDVWLGYNDFDWSAEENKVWVDGAAQWAQVIGDRAAKLNYGTPDYMEIITAIQDDNNDTAKCDFNYSKFHTDCKFAVGYKAVAARLCALSKRLNPTVVD